MIIKLQKRFRNKLFIILACGALLQLLLMRLGFMGDVEDFYAWADQILKHGTSTLYTTNFALISRANANYPPFILWLLALSLFFTHVLKNVLDFINMKLPFFPSKIISGFDPLLYFVTIYKVLFLLTANLVVAWFTYIFVSSREVVSKSKKMGTLALTAASLIVFNPALIYGSTMLGQADIIPLCFILGSVYVLFYRKNVILSSFLFVIALLFKQTVIIFFPIYFLAILMYFGWKNLLLSAAITLISIWLAFIPFVNHWTSLISPIVVYLQKVQFAPLKNIVTGSAWNFWFLLFGFTKVADTHQVFLGITYREIGYFLFFSSLLFIGYLYGKRVDKDYKMQAVSLFYAFSLSAFASALFITRLYERHFLQILPFLVLIYTGKKYERIKILFLSIFIMLNIMYYWNPPHAFFGTSLMLAIFIKLAIVTVLILFGSLLFQFYTYSNKKSK